MDEFGRCKPTVENFEPASQQARTREKFPFDFNDRTFDNNP